MLVPGQHPIETLAEMLKLNYFSNNYPPQFVLRAMGIFFQFVFKYGVFMMEAVLIYAVTVVLACLWQF